MSFPTVSVLALETDNCVRRRLNSGTSRRDFLSNVAAKVEDGEISREEMTAHSSTLV